MSLFPIDLYVAHLYFPYHPGGVHPAGHIDGIAPDVILRLLGPDDPSHDGAHVDPDPDLEVVEGMFVDVVELVPDPQSVHGHGLHVLVVNRGGLICQT